MDWGREGHGRGEQKDRKGREGRKKDGEMEGGGNAEAEKEGAAGTARVKRERGAGGKGFPCYGKLASMVWKNGKTGFHGVEVFPKLASMAWKNRENDFHGVELFALQGKTTTPREGGRGYVRADGRRAGGKTDCPVQ